jgi:hypothetical protein
VIRCFTSSKVTGTGGMKTLSLTNPHKKVTGVRSGLHGGQHVSDMLSPVARSIQRCGRFASR